MDYDDYEDGTDLDFEDDEPDFDCAWTPREGGCGKAGSEECDFECPYRDDMIADLERRESRRKA